ncbi:bifunctional diguanylate cyclase/phosphodiesterase [Methylobacillus methanolivorans]
MLSEGYNQSLVLVSLIVAMFASYAALAMSERVNPAKGEKLSRWWLWGSAATLGAGIWSMHFIGMLAFHLDIPLGYDPAITLLSLLVAILASGVALFQAVRPTLPLTRLAGSAVLMGVGVASMHYLGMWSMLMDPIPVYDPWLVILSILIAIAASGAAMWITFKLRHKFHRGWFARLGAALVMGAAIGGMHYTAMAAASFPLGSVCGAANGTNLDDLSIMVIAGVGSILFVAFIVTLLDAKLEVRISRFIHLARSLEQANKELLHRSLHDNLTNLPNRMMLESKVAEALSRAKRDQEQFALLFVDIDGFKTINDSLGHHVGDSLLVEVATRLHGILRGHDTVARMGGDEFVVLLERVNVEEACIVANKIVSVIRQPFHTEERELHVSTSIGIAMYPNHGANYRELAINADAAMYYTKRAGRNGYHVFEMSMHLDTRERLDMMLDLGAALERQQFVLMYQPKFDLHNHVVGFEVLLRWQHPTLGLVLPDHFVSLAEKSGLIIPIGEWVLNAACRQMKEWYSSGCEKWHVAINLSALQFSHERLLDVVRQVLARWELPPHCLTLEITETVAMHNAKKTLEILNQLSQLGVNISIDDFGTGYSSLLYLKRLPANELKIDKAFISNLGTGTLMDDQAIVSAIINLGHTLNFKVIAEGVENDEQKSFLQALGCDGLQGFGLAEPMWVDEVKDYYSSECKAG